MSTALSRNASPTPLLTPPRLPTKDEQWEREQAPGPYIVPEHQLRHQLQMAHSRMQPRTYRNVTVVHLMWDTPEDLSRFAAGTTAFSSVFSGYGFTIRDERIPVSAPTNTGTHRWLLDLLIQLREQQRPDDLLILHYRGGAGLQRFDRPFRVSPTPIYFLHSDTNREFDGPGSVGFGMVLHKIRSIRAQTILLMDCDYAVGSWTGNDGCRVDVLARCCNGSVFGDQSKDAFNDFLVKELSEGLEKRSWHSVPSLYAAMHKAGLRPFATRAASGGSCTSNAFRPLDASDGKYISLTADDATVDASIRLAEPGVIDSTDEAHIIQRVSRMLETISSDDTTIAGPKHFVQVIGAGLVDGWLRLRMSRILWHCLSAYRGWAEVDGNAVLEEGRELYFEPGVPPSELVFCCNDSDDEPDVVAGTPRF